jgi:hypothetical protein
MGDREGSARTDPDAAPDREVFSLRPPSCAPDSISDAACRLWIARPNRVAATYEALSTAVPSLIACSWTLDVSRETDTVTNGSRTSLDGMTARPRDVSRETERRLASRCVVPQASFCHAGWGRRLRERERPVLFGRLVPDRGRALACLTVRNFERALVDRGRAVRCLARSLPAVPRWAPRRRRGLMRWKCEWVTWWQGAAEWSVEERCFT